MKPPVFAYHAPRSVEETLELLAQLGAEAKVLAGGQSLVPMLNMRLVAPAVLVDIRHLDDLDTVEVADGRVRVGARVRHRRLERDDAAHAAQPVLREALELVAHPVIRNRGTSVGSIVHADPAAELPAVVALLDARLELTSRDGVRHVTGADAFLGPLESALRPGELATAVEFPVRSPYGGAAVEELARRHGDYALAGVAAQVDLDEDRRVTAAKAAFFGVGGEPAAIDVGQALAGQPADALRVDDAVGLARDGLDPDDDIHATASYRRHLAGVLLGRALVRAAAAATTPTAASTPDPAREVHA
ncbi:xanthine dehydrogenase family protein subunit M [Egicoccus sp. AB-alg2]|uniref:FAD binding domain-containing protein n=1 Tax=Egicoccus sp. AB-alg2 TaxID=3242693 RepID=UPI00359D9970